MYVQMRTGASTAKTLKFAIDLDHMMLVHYRLAFAAVCSALLAWAVTGFNFTDDDPTSADGCRYVYLDVGSNMGMHVRFLYEADKYPNNKYSKVIFDKYFMLNRNRRDICAFGFEPNPAHVPRLEHLTAHLHKLGLNAAFFHGAVSNQTSTAVFHGNPDDLSSGVGFSGIARTKYTAEFTVNTIDLSGFIMEKLAKRKIPPPLFPDDPPARIVMKMDIEGFEYVVLPMMIASKALCELDVLTIEYHDRRIDKIPRGSEIKLKEQLETERKNGCKVNILTFDDETYYLDTKEGLADLQ